MMTSHWLSPSAMKLTPDGAPETSARVHFEHVRSNPKHGHDGVILRDELRTATLREKIAPLYGIKIVENSSRGDLPLGTAHLIKSPELTVELVSGQLLCLSHLSYFLLPVRALPNYICGHCWRDPGTPADTAGGTWPSHFSGPWDLPHWDDIDIYSLMNS